MLDVGAAVRYLGLGTIALGVASSSLTFSWVVLHRAEHNFFPEFAGVVLYVSDIFLIGGLAIWTAGWNLSPNLNLKTGPWYVFIPLCALVILSAVSMFWAVDGAQAGYTAARRLMLLAVYFVIVTESTRALGPMVTALLVIGLLHSGIALAQVTHGSALGLFQLGELAEGAFGYEGIGGRGYRLGFNPNPVGMTLASVSVLAYGLFLAGRGSRSTRLFALASFLIITLGLTATMSRSASLGWIGGILLVSLLGWVGRDVARRTTLKRVGTVVILFLLVVGVSQFVATTEIADRLGVGRLPTIGNRFISERFSAVSSSTGLEGRFNDWKLSFPLIRENLAKGVGAGNHPAALRQQLGPESFGLKWTPIHNVPLTATAELGVAGGLAWALLMIAPFIWILGRIRYLQFEYHALLWLGPLLVVLFESLFDFPPLAPKTVAC
jgi:O-antigen ligase